MLGLGQGAFMNIQNSFARIDVDASQVWDGQAHRDAEVEERQRRQAELLERRKARPFKASA